MKGKSVLISGAGIAGPTLAYWLLKNGSEPVMVERGPIFREGGYMIDFWGLGLEVAERMGFLPRLREVGYKIDSVQFVDEENRLRSSLAASLFSRALGDRFVSLPRGDLARAIFDLVADRVEVIFGDSVTALREEGDGVEVTFAHAAPRRFDLVAGCDGLHSAMRATVIGTEEKFEKYLGYFAASFLTNGYPWRDERTYHSYAAPGRQISRYALRGDRTAFLFVFAREDGRERAGHDENPRRLLRETFGRDRWVETPEILRRLDACDDLYFDSVSQLCSAHLVWIVRPRPGLAPGFLFSTGS
ncbi:MAG: FAD-dependent monooxygenase [Chthoniobacterales bacterium]